MFTTSIKLNLPLPPRSCWNVDVPLVARSADHRRSLISVRIAAFEGRQPPGP
jgi:hypothetical protein